MDELCLSTNSNAHILSLLDHLGKRLNQRSVISYSPSAVCISGRYRECWYSYSFTVQQVSDSTVNWKKQRLPFF